MTYRKLLEALRATRQLGNWAVVKGRIRWHGHMDDHCPITRVYEITSRTALSLTHFDVAAQRLGLRASTAVRIQRASDKPMNLLSHRQRQVRRDLLRACGLR